MLVVNEKSEVTDALTSYFTRQASYQETIDKLHRLGARKELIQALPQATLDLGGKTYEVD